LVTWDYSADVCIFCLWVRQLDLDYCSWILSFGFLSLQANVFGFFFVLDAAVDVVGVTDGGFELTHTDGACAHFGRD
jgi:hypothetical protein